MVKICPSCGTRAVDDQSQFCNKCGYPFPKEQPRSTTTVTRTVPRPAAPQPPTAPAPAAPRPPAGSGGTGSGSDSMVAPLAFGRLLSRKIRLIYWIGTIVIVLVAVLGIAGVLSSGGTEGTNPALFTNTTAMVQTPAVSPLFWILFLAAGLIVWRVFCEIAAMLVRVHDAIGEALDAEEQAAVEEAGGVIASGSNEYVQCPRCGKVVTPDQLRICAHCGVQGCTGCIRLMGLFRKSLTCKDCFEKK